MTALAISEREHEVAVADFATATGWLSYHTHDSRHSAPGFPDRVFVRSPRLLLVEFKTEHGRASSAQQRWLDELTRTAEIIASYVDEVGGFGDKRFRPGVEVYVWRPSDWPTIEAVLR